MSPVEGVKCNSLIAYQSVVNKNFIYLILARLKIIRHLHYQPEPFSKSTVGSLAEKRGSRRMIKNLVQNAFIFNDPLPQIFIDNENHYFINIHYLELYLNGFLNLVSS